MLPILQGVGLELMLNYIFHTIYNMSKELIHANLSRILSVGEHVQLGDTIDLYFE